MDSGVLNCNWDLANSGTTIGTTEKFSLNWTLLRGGELGSHWRGAEVAELEVGPGGGRGLAQQQDGEQQQQQETQDRSGNQWLPCDPVGWQDSA